MQPTLDAAVLLRAPRNLSSYRLPTQPESAAPSTASSHPSDEPDDAYEPSYASSQSSHSWYPSMAGPPEPAPSSTSTSDHHTLPFPPPPQPLEPAYDNPHIPRLSPRRPLPSLPTGPRFVPLHPVPPAPPSLAKGKGRMSEEDLSAEEEKRAIARARGLDDLLEPQREDRDTGLASPATTELPGYPAVSRTVLERHASTSKRLLTSLPEEGERENEKALAAVEEVRRLATEDSARQVEDDMRSSKARLAREADEDELSRLAQDRAAEAATLEKRMEEQLHLEDIEGLDDPPPPITPDEDRSGMLPLTDSKMRLDSASHEVRPTPEVAPPSTSYRLPPPPIPITAQPAVDDFASPQPQRFELEHPVRPPLQSSRTAPIASVPRHQNSYELPERRKFATASPSSLDASPSAIRLPSVPSSDSLPLPSLPRHRSLGPAASFYSTGLGLADPSRSSALTTYARPRQASMIASEPSLRHELHSPGVIPSTSLHQRGLSWSESTALPPPASFASPPALTQPPPSLLAPTSQPVPAASALSEFGAIQQPYRSSSTTPALVHHPPPAQPIAPQSSASLQLARQPTPAFYTSVTPGGPLLPFYASASAGPGGPTSYFTPLSAAALPPSRVQTASLPLPPAQPVFASLPPPPPPVTFPSLAPPPQHLHHVASPPLLHSHRNASAHDLRPSSRSSSTSPSLPRERTPSKPGRAVRMSTIRGFFGKKGANGGGGLGDMPEE